MEIATLVAEGLTNKGIAKRLNIVEGTVKVHLHNIFERLKIPRRAALAARLPLIE
jgi:DNA-binding NarL/FixJ family response regulator